MWAIIKRGLLSAKRNIFEIGPRLNRIIDNDDDESHLSGWIVEEKGKEGWLHLIKFFRASVLAFNN